MFRKRILPVRLPYTFRKRRFSLPIMLRERRSLGRPSGEEVRAPNGIHRNSIRLINRLRSSVWNIDVMIAVSEVARSVAGTFYSCCLRKERQLAKGDIYESWNVDDNTIDLCDLYGRAMHDAGSTKSVGPECGRPNIRAGL